MEHVVQKKMALQKIDFPFYFQKCIWVEGTYFVTKKKFPKNSNTPEHTQVLVVTCPKLNSVAARLSPHPLFK